jgi:hypothetical protein
MAVIKDGLHFEMKDLHDNDFLGYVVDNHDPTFSGRCRVRVFRLMDDLDEKDLPWAVPINSTIFAGDGAGSISIPRRGIILRIQFNNGDIYSPEYTTIQNIDTQLIQRIKDDYDGTHVLLYDPDEELTVIYQRNSGFQMYYKGSFIQISPDSMITIEHANQESMIQLDGDKLSIVTKNEVNVSAAAKVSINADEVIASGNQATKLGPGPSYYHAVLAEVLFPLLQTMATALDAKMPQTPGVNVGLVQQAKQAATSTNVFISK